MIGGVWELSTETDDLSAGLGAGELDPVSGMFVVIGQSGMFVYDPANRTRVATIASARTPDGGSFDFLSMGYANNLVYAPTTDRMYYFQRDTGTITYEIALDREDWSATVVELLAMTGPTPPGEETGFAYDARNGIIGGGIADNTFYAFDPATHTWTSETITGGSPGAQAFHAIAYSPVDNVFIFRTGYDFGFRTWAYRFRNP